tara:strand:+ start:95 stop:334 length:240 start_codon:yes stop_codon:yes gene_type:complete
MARRSRNNRRRRSRRNQRRSRNQRRNRNQRRSRRRNRRRQGGSALATAALPLSLFALQRLAMRRHTRKSGKKSRRSKRR